MLLEREGVTGGSESGDKVCCWKGRGSQEGLSGDKVCCWKGRGSQEGLKVGIRCVAGKGGGHGRV